MFIKFFKILFNLFYKVYKTILYFVPEFLYKYIIKVLEDLISLTEANYYNKLKKKYKISIENLNFYIYSRDLELFSNNIGKMEKKIPQPNWGKEYIYEYSAIKILQNLLGLEKNPLFIDVGAYQGYYATYVSKYLNDRFPVYAIESNKEFCDDIEKTIKLNNFSNCKLIHAILSDQEKEMFFKSTAVGVASKKTFLKEKNILNSKTLDSIVNEFNLKPNILKIDVHGSEGPLLKGAQKTLKNSVNFILLELHAPSFINKYSPGYTRKMIVNNVIDLGFDCYAIGPFRTLDTDEGEIFLKQNKITYIKMPKQDVEKILFDISRGSMILAVRQGFNIQKLDCFIH